VRSEEHWVLGHGEWLKRVVFIHERLIGHIEHALVELRRRRKVRFVGSLLREGRRDEGFVGQEVEMRWALFRVTRM